MLYTIQAMLRFMSNILFFSVSSIVILLGNSCAFFDAPDYWQVNFQMPATSLAKMIYEFHNDIMFIEITILLIVFYMMFILLVDGTDSSKPELVDPRYAKTEHVFLEIFWTVVPALILLVLSIPSFLLLYAADSQKTSLLTVKVVGRQWYWNYSYSAIRSFNNLDLSPTGDTTATGAWSLRSVTFDSYMVSVEDLLPGAFRLLEVDNALTLPINVGIRALVTSGDVLHSWAIPSLGVKIDACPGRLNQVPLYILREGTYYGQCSEICGVNHAFMPITIKGIWTSNYM